MKLVRSQYSFPFLNKTQDDDDDDCLFFILESLTQMGTMSFDVLQWSQCVNSNCYSAGYHWYRKDNEDFTFYAAEVQSKDGQSSQVTKYNGLIQCVSQIIPFIYWYHMLYYKTLNNRWKKMKKLLGLFQVPHQKNK